jgi:hypothetical protein
MESGRERALIDDPIWNQSSCNALPGSGLPVGVSSPALSPRCKMCSRDFKHSHALKMHLENSTAHRQTRPTIPTSNSGKTKKASTIVRCNICRESFVNKIALGKHIRGSERLEQFSCVLCEREFINEDGYRMHIKTSKRHKAKLAVWEGEECSGEPNAESRGVPREDSVLSVTHSEALLSQDQQMRAENGVQHMLVLAYRGPKLAVCPMEGHPTRPISINSLAIIQYQSRSDQRELEVNDNSNCLPTRRVSRQWSVIPQHEMNTALEILSRLCHPPEHLAKNSYRLCMYTSEDVDGYRKCRNCSGKY